MKLIMDIDYVFSLLILVLCLLFAVQFEIRCRQLFNLLDKLDEIYPIIKKIDYDIISLANSEVNPYPWILMRSLCDEAGRIKKEVDRIDKVLKRNHNFSAEEYFQNIKNS